MTFETLLFIHKLLKEEEESARKVYTSRRDYVSELLDLGNATKEALAEARSMRDSADRIHSKALKALNEFEEHEWR